MTRMLKMTSHKDKDTDLQEAVHCNHLVVVQLLTREDPNLPYDTNKAGETPLYLATERGYAEVLKQILGTCDSPADHGPCDRMALHVAVIRYDEGEFILLGLCEQCNGFLELFRFPEKSSH
ncbi:hypothetical protein LWI29_027873 [Acer saccharum]|uniref:Uncharacterized protein n=1 Tax=Acer saccharum TaxID=4024 RepID=A0AA39SV80_ACESA|nr:hypothetical protein LWI29_027873 [Acer saccharum]